VLVQHDITRWFDEALAQVPVELDADCDGTTHRRIVDSYLRPLLKRCRATTKSGFWQWLRLQLAKTEETATYLTWMRESRCPLEGKISSTPGCDGGFQYVVNGDVALIEVTNDADRAVWRVPASQLEWALSLYPVTLRRLPVLESDEARQLRLLKRRIKRSMPFLTPAQREAFEREILALENSQRQAYEPIPRFQLVKYADGREIPVHRLYTNASRNDEIEAVDGDFLNFTTAKIRITVEPVPESGFAIAKGDRRPEAWEEEVTVQNLQIINNAEAQKVFEKAVLQIKETPQGDIKTTLRIQPNADLGKRTGIEGGIIADCGSFVPLSPEERVEAGLAGAEVRPADEVAALRRKWLVPKSAWGTKWG
jgi:hypothetical protein